MKKFFKCIYVMFAQYLPHTGFSIFGIKIGRICCRLRVLCVQKMRNEYVAKDANIERKVTIPYNISIGKRSGIGEGSRIPGGVYIGDNVMIGPELFCYTVNHNYDDTSIPMIEQGMSEVKPIIICDDV